MRQLFTVQHPKKGGAAFIWSAREMGCTSFSTRTSAAADVQHVEIDSTVHQIKEVAASN